MHKTIQFLVAFAFLAASVAAQNTKGLGLGQPVGTVKPHHAREITGSNWSVGAETMDRDYTVYKNWREHLGPLGIKKARIQSGWAKTEKAPGEYDWAWLDEIIRDMPKQGVTPWVCLSYGNPLYQANEAKLGNLGSNPSLDPKFMEPWLRFVGAFVDRYKDVVNEWELWNEPHGGAKFAPDYARFMIATAEAIRARQPEAKIIGFAMAGIDMGLAQGGLDVLKAEGKLGLLDFVCYHPYSVNPDNSYAKCGELRRLVNSYDPRIRIFQGENGAPSQRAGFGAIANYDWTEERQAKWAMRRLLGDLGRDIPSSYFSICDMHYPGKVNYKGLIRTKADKTVDHPKQSYYAVQRVAAIFDDKLKRVPEFKWSAAPAPNADKTFSAFAYADGQGRSIVTAWRRDLEPGDGTNGLASVELALEQVKFNHPVLVDMLSGNIYEIPAGDIKDEGERVTVKNVPLYDSVVLIAERDLIPMK